MDLPIGLLHLAKHLPSALSPTLVTYLALQCVLRLEYYKFSSALILIISFLAIPVYWLVSSVWTSYAIRLAARRHGAILPPNISDWFGGMTLAKQLEYSVKHGYTGDIIEEWAKTYGQTFSFTILSEDRLFTTEPQHVKAILATQFDDFEKGPATEVLFRSMLGTGVFNSDGERWKFHRSMTRPFFSKERISDFDNFDRHAEDALYQAKVRLAEGHPIDFQDMISKFTIDSATEFLFGQDVRCLSAGLEYPGSSPLSVTASNPHHPANVFARAFVEGQHVTAGREQHGSHWPLFEWNDKVKPYREIVNQFIDPIVDAAIGRYNARLANGSIKATEAPEDATLLDHLVNNTQDHQILQDEILNIMIAGRDTTASTMTYGVYMLAEHPDILARLRTEILEKVGPIKRPDFDDLRNMKYLRAFINETLRLYPPVPFDARMSKRDTTLPPSTLGGRPFFVPAHTNSVYSVFLMHRRKDLWGPTAWAFDPERFLDERVKLVTKNPYMFLPFNGGPRICLGQQFAYHEISFFLIKLLQKFSGFSLAPEAQPPLTIPPPEWKNCAGTKGTEKVIPTTHLTMGVKGGLWIRMTEADTEKVH